MYIPECHCISLVLIESKNEIFKNKTTDMAYKYLLEVECIWVPY